MTLTEKCKIGAIIIFILAIGKCSYEVATDINTVGDAIQQQQRIEQ